MVKVKTICRSPRDHERETKLDLFRVERNPNPNLHPFAKAREYQRALVATKLEKIFAKPFVGNLSGHSDGISAMAKTQKSVGSFLSASYDGEIRYWDLPLRKTQFSINAHATAVYGLTFASSGNHFLSCGDDKVVNLFSVRKCIETAQKTPIEPLQKFFSNKTVNSVDHHWKDNVFATSGEVVQLWNYERSLPIQTFEWGIDSILKLRFNPSEVNILVSVGMDRSICLYDIRGGNPITKTFLQNKSTCVCWNPQEPLNFTVGNDDANCYTFDMRKLEAVKMIHKDHIQAIMDIDYAPTGKEFVTASFDKTVRIFDVTEGKSREVYHTKRMQKVFSVLFSMDNHYILCGSEDFNVRIWKSNPSAPIGPSNLRQARKLDYRERLKDKFKHNPEIRRILKHRHLPKYVLNAKKKRQIMRDSKHRKIKNQELNNPDFEKPAPERKKKVTETME